MEGTDVLHTSVGLEVLELEVLDDQSRTAIAGRLLHLDNARLRALQAVRR